MMSTVQVATPQTLTVYDPQYHYCNDSTLAGALGRGHMGQ